MKRKSKVPRRPVEVFPQCPSCKSCNLIQLEVDVLCADCDWMSCEEFVEMGGMDNILSAFRNHFPLSSEDEVLEILAEQKRDCMDQDNFRDTSYPVEVGA